MVFDDTFRHEAWNAHPDRARVVLMIDFEWGGKTAADGRNPDFVKQMEEEVRPSFVPRKYNPSHLIRLRFRGTAIKMMPSSAEICWKQLSSSVLLRISPRVATIALNRK